MVSEISPSHLTHGKGRVSFRASLLLTHWNRKWTCMILLHRLRMPFVLKPGPVTRKFSARTLVPCSAYGGLRTLVRAQRFLGVTQKFSGWARMLKCCHARFSDVNDDNRPCLNQQSTAISQRMSITLWHHILEGTSHIYCDALCYSSAFCMAFCCHFCVARGGGFYLEPCS